VTLHDELLDLEEKGWQALSSGRGAEFYDAFMTDDAVMVLPFAVLDRAGTVAAMRDAPPWSTHTLEDVRVVALGESGAAIVYKATAQREGQPVYRALMSTTYVRQDDEWLVAIHQQTPLPAE
jgi:ketosteroid isomerase-like protein